MQADRRIASKTFLGKRPNRQTLGSKEEPCNKSNIAGAWCPMVRVISSTEAEKADPNMPIKTEVGISGRVSSEYPAKSIYLNTHSYTNK